MIQKLKKPQVDPYNRPNENMQQFPIGRQPSGDSQLHVKTSSLRFSRRKFTFAITAFVMGAVLILMQSPARNDFIAPGPLASHHAQILKGQGAQRCSACHDAGDQSLSQWVANGFRPGNNAKACQSVLCMKCHQDSFSKEFATKPHNVDPKTLDSKTLTLVSTKAAMMPVDHNGDIQCSACHREHHGLADLKKMTDQQCQSCHSKKYHRFETDHPEFANWPQRRRQRIAFDHVSHNFKHFPGKEQTFDCMMCHVDDRLGNVKLLASYEQTCSQCHDDDITSSSEEGLHLVSLPMLDLDAIQDQKLSIGDWPKNATGDFDGQIPELMKMLLYKNNKAAAILESRGEDFEFADLDPDDSQDVNDAVQLAWATKYLLYDLATGGEVEFRKRLEFALQRSLTEPEFIVLTQGLNAEVFARTANRWLPKLAREVPLRREQFSNQSVAEMIRSERLLKYFQDEDPGLLIENPIANLIKPDIVEFEAGSERTTAEQRVVQPMQPDVDPNQETADLNWLNSEAGNRQPVPTDSFSPSQESLQQPVPESMLTTQQPEQSAFVEVVIPEADLLAANPFLNDMRFRNTPNLKQSNVVAGPQHKTQKVNNGSVHSDESIKPGNVVDSQITNSTEPKQPTSIPENELLAENPLSGSSVVIVPKPKSFEAIPSEVESKIAQEFVEQVNKAKAKANGERTGSFEIESDLSKGKFIGSRQKSGWYRNDQIFQISFRPAGHADKFMTSLIGVVVETPDANENPAIAPIFNKMTSDASVGACNRCHTIDEKEMSVYHVNWSPAYRDPLIRSFTRFSHRPHLTQPQLRDCTGCHSMDENQCNAATFNHFDGSEFVSNFKAITKANCMSCHFNDSTNSGCTQCHSYHVGSRVTISQ